MKRFRKWSALKVLLVVCWPIAGYAFQTSDSGVAPLPKNHGRVNTQLYTGEGEKQPLLVGFGGSEGGNAWASDRWKPQRDRFISQGYAFLAVAYFGEEGVPPQVDRIALEGVHAAIAEAANAKK